MTVHENVNYLVNMYCC